jgi:signal transduction histidine kinase
MQALTARLISVQESNNRTLARELHDDLSQRVAAVALDIKRIADHPPDSAVGLQTALRQASELIGKTAADIHQLSRQLHPAILEDLGLPAALRAECAAFVERHNVPCEFITRNVPYKIPEDISLCIYRVVQEALRNVGKHAGAETVEVRLMGTKKAINLSIVDEGDGFDLENVKLSTGLGLVSMEERTRMVGGQFSLTSQEGHGTSVRVSIPVSREVE